MTYPTARFLITAADLRRSGLRLLNEHTVRHLAVQATTSGDVLTTILFEGADRLLGRAIEAEVHDRLKPHEAEVHEMGVPRIGLRVACPRIMSHCDGLWASKS